jgi:hypothetical protein
MTSVTAKFIPKVDARLTANSLNPLSVLLRKDSRFARLGNRIAGASDVTTNHGLIINHKTDDNQPQSGRTPDRRENHTAPICEEKVPAKVPAQTL